MTEEQVLEKSFYELLCQNDVHGWLKPLWNGGGYYMRDDGVLEPVRRTIAIDTPWIHHGHAYYTRCLLWHQILFDVVSKLMPQIYPGSKRFVPSGCQDCYKVVVRPQTVVQLFALNELQSQTYRPCKCGIERRDTVEGHYGGYFYNHGLENGKECYKWVRKTIDEYHDLGPEIPVILKRACTEMEAAIGPSDQWEIMPGQEHVEYLVEKWVNWKTNEQATQPEPVKTHVMRSWLEFAASINDQTYRQFTNGEPINKPYVTYHDKGGENGL